MHEILISAEFGLSTIIKLLPFILTVVASAFAIIVLEFYPSLTNNLKLSNIGYNIYGFFNQRLLLELFINKYIVNSVLKVGGQTTKILDRGSIELIGPFGAEKGLLSIGKLINGLSTGMVTNYALYIITGIILYLIGSNFYLFNINNTLLLSILCVNIIVIILGMKTRNNTNLVVLESGLVLSRRSKFKSNKINTSATRGYAG
jgi:NADH-ubiquinone oxidoreductase chain 5